MTSLQLPLDYAAIERILPHRYPFLLVDRITEFEVDTRIVGIKNVSLNEPLLWHGPGGPALILAATALGFGLGAEVDVIGFMVSRYFGLRSFGEIYGCMFAIFTVLFLRGAWTKLLSPR